MRVTDQLYAATVEARRTEAEGRAAAFRQRRAHVPGAGGPVATLVAAVTARSGARPRGDRPTRTPGHRTVGLLRGPVAGGGSCSTG